MNWREKVFLGFIYSAGLMMLFGCPRLRDKEEQQQRRQLEHVHQGVVAKVEWIEDGRNEVVLTFQDGRVVKLRTHWSKTYVFQIGKEHKINCNGNRRIEDMQIVERRDVAVGKPEFAEVGEAIVLPERKKE